MTVLNGIKDELDTSAEHAPTSTEAVLRLLSHYKHKLPASRNIRVVEEAAAVIHVADELLASSLASIARYS